MNQTKNGTITIEFLLTNNQSLLPPPINFIGLEDFYNLSQEINITATSEVNTTEPSWFLNCSQNGTYVFNQTQNSSSLNISANLFNNGTLCIANFSVGSLNGSNGA